MNQKAFTLVELLAVIMILGIVLTIATYSYSNHLKNSRDQSYKLAENSFQDAVSEAYVDCKANYPNNDFCNNHEEPNVVGEIDRVYLYELIEDEYIEKIKNPYNTNQNCDFNNSYVEIESNINIDNSDHNDLSYKVCLICGTKSSEGCYE